MGCGSSVRTIKTETATIFSRGGTSPGANDVFVLSPESINEIAPMLAAVRATIVVENATPDFLSQVVFQTSSDGDVWQTVPLEQAPASDNRKATTGWYDNKNDFRRAIRFGVVASQETGVTGVQLARVSLTIDLRMEG